MLTELNLNIFFQSLRPLSERKMLHRENWKNWCRTAHTTDEEHDYSIFWHDNELPATLAELSDMRP